MSEPSEWAMEKARKVIEIDGIPDHAPLLQRFARALMEAVEAEREACALVADDVQGEGETAEEFDDGWNGAAMTIARAIRDRGGNNE